MTMIKHIYNFTCLLCNIQYFHLRPLASVIKGLFFLRTKDVSDALFLHQII